MKNKHYMKIYHKDSWGFWIFTRHSLYVQDEEESLTELIVDKSTWSAYNVGDYYTKHEDKEKARVKKSTN